MSPFKFAGHSVANHLECGSTGSTVLRPYCQAIHACSSAELSRCACVIASDPWCSCSIPTFVFWPGQCAETTMRPFSICDTVPQRPCRIRPLRQTRKLWPESFHGFDGSVGDGCVWLYWMFSANRIDSARDSFSG